MKITKSQIKWITSSWVDEVGRVFEYDDRLFRVIYPEKRNYIYELFEGGLIEELISRGFLVPTWIANDIELDMEEFSGCMIIEHKKIIFNTNISEWTDSMYVDVGKLIANLNCFLISCGYELSDPGEQNVTFDGCKPVYLDLGSIAPEQEMYFKPYLIYKALWLDRSKLGRKHYNVFRKAITLGLGYRDLNILRENELYDKKRDAIDKLFYPIQFDNSLIVKTLRCTAQKLCNNKEKRIKRKSRLYDNHRIYIRNNSVGGESENWRNYQKNLIDQNGQIIVDERFTYYINLVKKIKDELHGHIDTLLEMGGNQGVLSQAIIERNLANRVCCQDYSEDALEVGYLRTKNQKDVANRITYCRRPFFVSSDNICISSEDRFSSDVVIALALTHHLLLAQRLTLQTVVSTFKRYARKYLIVEFMPLGLYSASTNPNPSVPSWYTLEWFLDGFSGDFDIVSVKEIAKNRVSIVLKRKLKNTI